MGIINAVSISGAAKIPAMHDSQVTLSGLNRICQMAPNANATTTCTSSAPAILSNAAFRMNKPGCCFLSINMVMD